MKKIKNLKKKKENFSFLSNESLLVFQAIYNIDSPHLPLDLAHLQIKSK